MSPTTLLIIHFKFTNLIKLGCRAFGCYSYSCFPCYHHSTVDTRQFPDKAHFHPISIKKEKISEIFPSTILNDSAAFLATVMELFSNTCFAN
jgi:hypothetical protein